MNKNLISVIILCCSLSAVCQSVNLDGSVSAGINPAGQQLMIHLTPGLGYAFKEHDYLYGGVDLGMYRFDDNPSGDASNSTYGFISAALYTGFRYTWTLGMAKKGTSKEKEVGFFVDPRIYFTPYLPRVVRFEDYLEDKDQYISVKRKGDWRCQLAYGVGMGLYFKPRDKEGYWAIRAEYSTIDPFVTLRELDFPYASGLPGSSRIILGISIFHW